MYMLTRGNSQIPLIKLSEGYSYNQKHNYTTVVCGSNGEKLTPVKIWEEPFVFFKKEKLTAEFVSRTELIYVRVTELDHSKIIDIIKYRLDDILINNTEIEYDALRHMKPITESMLHIELENDANISELESFLKSIANGAFTNAVMAAMYKINHKDEFCYGTNR